MWIPYLGSLVEFLPFLQQGCVLASVPLTGCNIPNSTVAMFLVVPLHESMYPLAYLMYRKNKISEK
uniref:Uncharacterized protein n=1 Tax=Candidatus Kentrum sp. TUN TaxID=2126343 RepID=A0A451B2I8_9GAMM|nr:MAG: hypothetical protein BECKTUN1418E_GA0071001_14281 [Candidatus Kentron sp. TUN]